MAPTPKPPKPPPGYVHIPGAGSYGPNRVPGKPDKGSGYGGRNPGINGPRDPEPSPGTGKYPLPPRIPRPKGLPGGGQGGPPPPGFGGPRKLPFSSLMLRA